MKRPFFLLAIFISLLIWAANFFIRYDLYQPGHISYFVSERPRHLAVEGIVESVPTLKRSAFGQIYSFLVKPKLVRVGDRWFPARGIISVTSHKDVELDYGEEIIFEAEIRGFSDREGIEKYYAYLKRNGIFAFATIRKKDALVPTEENDSPGMLRFAYESKTILKKRIHTLFSAPSRYFLDALLLGDRENISKRWKDIFVNTQTIHLLAISGLHVAIISFIALFLLGLMGLPRNFKYITAVILILFYSVMVGWMPSVARSAIMGVILLGSYVLKRDVDIYNSLGLAACIILIFQPNQLFDMGFILSFVSVLSLVYIMPKINRTFGFDKMDRKNRRGNFLYYLAMLCSGSLAVWLGLFPIILYSFKLISLVSLLVNIVAIPCTFAVMAFAISALIFSPFCVFLTTAFKESTEFFIAALLWFLDLSSKIPFAYFKSEPVSVIIIPIYYFILFLVFFSNSIDKGICA